MILVAAVLLAATATYAQTEKGTQNLGINLGFSYNKNEQLNIYPNNGTPQSLETKSTHFSFGPSYSYFIANDLDLGANLSFDNTHMTNVSNNDGYPNKQSSHNYGGNIFLRKYFMYKDKIGLRAGPYAGYTRSNSKVEYSGTNTIYDQNSNTNSYDAGIMMDLVYYPSKKLGFSATLANLNYNHYKTDSGANGHSENDEIGLNFINSGIGLSVFYVLGK